MAEDFISEKPVQNKLKEAEEQLTLRPSEQAMATEPTNELTSLVEESFKLDAALPIAQENLVGEVLDNRYRLDSVIGSGATSDVYSAYDLQTNSSVALKLLHKHLCMDQSVTSRFLREAKTASILKHPNIARVLGCGQTQSGQPYHVMEFVDGQNLQQLMKDSGGWLSWQKSLGIFAQVCAALAVAHENGIVHRDIKPTNIMVCKSADGHELVKVLDFGIAKILPAEGETHFRATQTGETLGSLLYMSPEQCLDENVDERSDIYSLGCVMYETLTGKPAFIGRTAFLTMNQHLTSEPQRFSQVRPDLDLPEGLEAIVFKAASSKVADRYQTITELGDTLQAFSRGERTPQTPQQAGSVQAKKRPRTVLIAALLIVTQFVFIFISQMMTLHTDQALYKFLLDSGMCFTGPKAFLAFKILAGRNWARIIFCILFLYGLGINLAQATTTMDYTFTLIVFGFDLCAVSLMYSEPGSSWFRKAAVNKIATKS